MPPQLRKLNQATLLSNFYLTAAGSSTFSKLFNELKHGNSSPSLPKKVVRLWHHYWKKWEVMLLKSNLFWQAFYLKETGLIDPGQPASQLPAPPWDSSWLIGRSVNFLPLIQTPVGSLEDQSTACPSLRLQLAHWKISQLLLNVYFNFNNVLLVMC